nr:MAG TPA: Protein of unknown function (DUF1492) [Caudoviricetes sp.]
MFCRNVIASAFASCPKSASRGIFSRSAAVTSAQTTVLRHADRISSGCTGNAETPRRISTRYAIAAARDIPLFCCIVVLRGGGRGERAGKQCLANRKILLLLLRLHLAESAAHDAHVVHRVLRLGRTAAELINRRIKQISELLQRLNVGLRLFAFPFADGNSRNVHGSAEFVLVHALLLTEKADVLSVHDYHLTFIILQYAQKIKSKKVKMHLDMNLMLCYDTHKFIGEFMFALLRRLRRMTRQQMLDSYRKLVIAKQDAAHMMSADDHDAMFSQTLQAKAKSTLTAMNAPMRALLEEISDPRTFMIIQRYYVKGLTDQAIGREMNLTGARVNQIRLGYVRSLTNQAS